MTTRREALGMIGLATSSMLIGTLAGNRELGAAPKPGFPWKYEKLDPVVVAERAYKGYWEGRCCYGSFEAIVGELADKKGAPYNTFPMDIMRIGVGGGADWTTLCGAIMGPMFAMSLLSAKPMDTVDELFGWYEQTALPDYEPKSPKEMIKVTSISRSPLCHVSVSRWCKVAKVKSFSKERTERCAWMTACCAKKAVEILNAQADGVLKASYPLPKRVQECRSCHDKGGVLENARGKMDCGVCHFNLKTEHVKI
jgi:hypothetical protein